MNDGTPKEILTHNRAAWDGLVEQNNRWTVPVTDTVIEQARNDEFSIVLTPNKPIPREWFGDLQDCNLLCLAGAGGQQAPVLAAAGANVTVLDNSPKQLEQDQVVARRHGLSIRSELGDMADLSVFDDECFDLIVHPCSNGYVPKVRPVWIESHRVLRQGGKLMAGFCSPVMFIFDQAKSEQGELIVRHKLPFSELEDISAEELEAIKSRNEPFGFGHTLTDQLGGQLDAGLLVCAMYEDNWGDSPEDPLCEYMDTFIATLAFRPLSIT